MRTFPGTCQSCQPADIHGPVWNISTDVSHEIQLKNYKSIPL